MARIRYLKPDFFKDDDLCQHPHWIRLLYQGLWTLADKEGRLEDRVMRIKAEIFPYESANVDEGLGILSQPKKGSGTPFIIRYIVNDQKYIQIVKWTEHQKPHHTEKDSVIPSIPPLNTKGNRKGDYKDKDKPARSKSEVKQPLSNGDLTVKEPLKVKHQDYVLLTKAEHNKLIEHFGEEGTKKRIEALNHYIGSKGKKYRNHYHTILSWENSKTTGDANGRHAGSTEKNEGSKYTRIPETVIA